MGVAHAQRLFQKAERMLCCLFSPQVIMHTICNTRVILTINSYKQLIFVSLEKEIMSIL